MRTLVLDTSTERGAVALVEDDAPLFSIELPFGLHNSKHLFTELSKEVTKREIDLSSLDYIAVGIGPGSYTGIRVGATLAKTFAFAHQIPLIGISTLETFLPEQEEEFAVLIDAKIGGVYIFKGVLRNGEVTPLLKPSVVSLEEASQLLDQKITVVTPYAASLKQKLQQIEPNLEWNWEEKYPSMLFLAKKSKTHFLNREFSKDGQIDLLYMRKTQAEIEKETKKKDSP